MSYDLIKVWYQNDWGLYRRRDEQLSVQFAKREEVSHVFHIEPPIDPARLEQWAQRSPMEANALWQRERMKGTLDRGVHVFTPTLDPGISLPTRARECVERQLLSFLEGRGLRQRPFVLWLSAPSIIADICLELLGDDAARIVVEVEDDHRVYYPKESSSRAAVDRLYHKLLSCSDIGVSNSERMIDTFSKWQPRFVHAPNGVDAEAFASEQASSLSSDRQQKIDSFAGRKIGYVGNLSLRLEGRILEAIASSRPQDSLVLAGPPGPDVLALSKAYSNVHLLGVLPAVEGPAFLRQCDALIMPHVVGELTEGMNPQKLHEYVASGVPVISTRVQGTQEYAGLISLCDDPDRFSAAIDQAIEQDHESARNQRIKAGCQRTWQNLAPKLLDEVMDTPHPGKRLQEFRRRIYFEMSRPEVRELVPHSATSVLDIGCGAGALGQALKQERGVRIVGIEADAEAAEQARGRFDRVINGTVPEAFEALNGERFDAVIMADVLEHVADSAMLLKKVSLHLKEGGRLILSVPNARHWSLIRELIEGDFRYREAGLLDRTHLRFFTRQSLQRLLSEQGFGIDDIRAHTWWPDAVPRGVLEALSEAGLWVKTLEEESNIHQFLVVAQCLAPASDSSDKDQNRGLEGETHDLAKGEGGVENPALAKFQSNHEPLGEEESDGAPTHVEGEIVMSGQAPLGIDVTLICPVVDNLEVTIQFLESLRAHPQKARFRLLVIDNGSGPEAREWLSQQTDIDVLRQDQNVGFARAINIGLRAAKTPYVGVINNDVIVTEGWLDRMVEHLDQDPRIGFVAPSTNYAASSQQVEVGSYDQVDTMEDAAKEFTDTFRGQTEDVEFLVGLCLLGRSETWRDIGEWDESFGLGNFEDNDYCLRARKMGYRLVIARDVFLHHHGSRTFQSLKIDYANLMEENRKIFEKKWGQDPGRLGHRLIGEKNFVEALKHLTQELKDSPKSADTFLRVGLCLIKCGDLNGSLEPLDRYLDANPRAKEASLLKAHALVGLGRFADALPILEDVEQNYYLSPSSKRELKTTQSSLYHLSEEPLKAFEALDTVIEEAAKRESLYEQYLEFAVKTGDPRVMLRALEKLSRFESGDVVLKLELAQLKKTMGDENGARRAWEEALRINPQEKEALAGLESLAPETATVGT